MSLSSVELWQRLTASQLASPMQCRAWAADAATGLTASQAIDGEEVARQLVVQGKLTQFQVDTLLAGTDQPLVRNGYRLLEPVNLPSHSASDVRCIWPQWWVVAKTQTASALWMRWLDGVALNQPAVASAHPALPRVLQHAQVNHERLQVVKPPEMAAGTLQISVEPVSGKLLSSLCDGGEKSVDGVMSLLIDISSALASLHAVGLAHGRVTPDRICLGNDARYQLLRDPLCGATLQLTDHASETGFAQGLIGVLLPEKLNAAHFMAPESLLPAQVATSQSDCYSLGCVAWLLLTGKPPFHADTPAKIQAAHAETPLNRKALAKVPEPLAKCIWHCLAKNPASRFKHAQQLLDSLQVAQRVLVAGPSSTPITNRPIAKPNPASNPASTPASAVASPVASDNTSSLATGANVPIASPAPAEANAQAKAKPEAKSEAKTEKLSGKQPTSASPVTKTSAAVAADSPMPLASSAARTSKGAAPAKPAPTQPAPATQPVPASKPVTAGKPTPASAPINVDQSEPLDAQPTVNPTTTSIAAVATNAAATSLTETTVSSETVAATAESKSEPAQSDSSAAAPKRALPGKPPARRATPGARSSGVRSTVRKTAGKRAKSSNWLTPVIGGGALLVLLLVIAVINGGLGFAPRSSVKTKPATAAAGNGGGTDSGASGQPDAAVPPADPRAERFELVDADPNALWAPPRAPEPIPLDLLPPGGQFFAALRPASLLSQPENRQLLKLLDEELSPLWQWVNQVSGIAMEQIEQVVIAAYPGQSGVPQYALRVQLTNGRTLSELKTAWKGPSENKVDQQSLLVSGANAYYVATQPLVDSQSVTEFAFGPLEMMREVAGAAGGSGPLSSQMEQLWQATDRQSELNLLVNPIFLFTEGRSWLERVPPRLASNLQQWLARDMRGAMFTSSLGSLGNAWFYELRLTGATDRDAAVNQQKLADTKGKLALDMENWLVNELPHPYWRAVANRYPSMLRALDAQTRVGSENGQAIANGYLPLSAAPNLVYASWMAFQPASTTSTGAVAATSGSSTPAQPPMTAPQILDRSIKLVIDQTGIENVLAAIGEAANEKLPAGSKPLRFELDGAAFQRSGITRNQQIRDFKIENQSVRAALTLLAKRGNPVQPLDDLKSEEQKLIWVLIDNADGGLISLTSREAAMTAQQKLPSEFQ